MATIFETQDGSHSLYSDKYGVSYHSKYGAVQETQHVFIEAALRQKGIEQKHLSVLEIGFGSGLNAFMTYLEAKNNNWKVDYVTHEAYPISIQEASNLNYASILNVPKDQDTFLLLHTSPWKESQLISKNFRFQKKDIPFEEINYSNLFDVIYFDAFAPSAQPELWNESMLKKMFEALKPGGILTTYCAKGVVKRTFKSVGFEIEAIQGPPGKREMTRARKKN